METLLIAIVAGFVGGVGAKLLELRGSRLAHLRERQLEASDDFAAAANDIYITLGASMEALGSPEGREAEWQTAFRAAVLAARDGVHETTRRLSRIELLFGRGSDPAIAAVEAVKELHLMSNELTKDEPDTQAVVDAFERGSEAVGRFTDRSHATITAPVWKPAIKTAPPGAGGGTIGGSAPGS